MGWLTSLSLWVALCTLVSPSSAVQPPLLSQLARLHSGHHDHDRSPEPHAQDESHTTAMPAVDHTGPALLATDAAAAATTAIARCNCCEKCRRRGVKCHPRCERLCGRPCSKHNAHKTSLDVVTDLRVAGEGNRRPGEKREEPVKWVPFKPAKPVAIPKVHIPNEHIDFPAPILPRPGKLPPPLKLQWGTGITAGKSKKQKAEERRLRRKYKSEAKHWKAVAKKREGEERGLKRQERQQQETPAPEQDTPESVEQSGGEEQSSGEEQEPEPSEVELTAPPGGAPASSSSSALSASSDESSSSQSQPSESSSESEEEAEEPSGGASADTDSSEAQVPVSSSESSESRGGASGMPAAGESESSGGEGVLAGAAVVGAVVAALPPPGCVKLIKMLPVKPKAKPPMPGPKSACPKAGYKAAAGKDFAGPPKGYKFTYSMWVKPVGKPKPPKDMNKAAASQLTLIQRSVNGMRDICPWVTLRGADFKLKYYCSTKPKEKEGAGVRTPQALEPNKWSHVAYTHEKGDEGLKVYVNGILAAKAKSPADPLRTAGDLWASQPFSQPAKNVIISSLMYGECIAKPGEVKGLMTASKPVPGKPPANCV